jgi:hypothetical protein
VSYGSHWQSSAVFLERDFVRLASPNNAAGAISESVSNVAFWWLCKDLVKAIRAGMERCGHVGRTDSVKVQMQLGRPGLHSSVDAVRVY